jgi:hypothetical protein
MPLPPEIQKRRSEWLGKKEVRYFPVPKESARLTQEFGHEGHGGVDFGVPTGTPIVAPVSGSVVSLQDETTGYGRHVRVRTDEGEILIFGHLSRFAEGLGVGSEVESGEVLGAAGSTGQSTGPHLHFERRGEGGGVLDPRPLLSNSAGPNLDALTYDLGPGRTPQSANQPRPSLIDVDQQDARTRKDQQRSQTERTGPDYSTVGAYGQFAGEDAPIEPAERSTPLLRSLRGGWLGEQIERSAWGGLGVVLIIVGLLIVSKGLRQSAGQAIKTTAGAVVGGPAGAAAGASA